jgi:hypothetical protein
MKYLLLALLLAGCTNSKVPTYSTTIVNVITLDECPKYVVNNKHYANFVADSGDVLYFSTHVKYKPNLCLKRKIKPRHDPQCRPPRRCP